jgi:hypothetical protein
MISRKEFMQEMQLRQHVREAIKVVQKYRRSDEQKLRGVIRQIIEKEGSLDGTMRALINEAEPAVADNATHANTGINALEDLFKNTNLLTVLRQGFKSLTSKEEQRESYKNHILNAVSSSLEVEDARYTPPGGEAERLQEDIDIGIGGKPEDHPAFLDVEKKEPTEEEEVEGFTIAGQDRTGRNRAYTDYKNVEKNLITAFDDLDDPKDREMFKDYLLTNLKLYFERFEEELRTDLPEPDIKTPEGAEVTEPAAEEEAGLGLQERINLDMDEVVGWLLSNDTKK